MVSCQVSGSSAAGQSSCDWQFSCGSKHVITFPARIWWRPTTLPSPRSVRNFLNQSPEFSITRWLTSCRTAWNLTTDHHAIASQFLKLWVATSFSVAISWQLNAVPYLCGVHKPCPLLRKIPCTWSTRYFTCALVSFSDQWVSFPDQWTWYLAWEQDYMCASIQH